MRGTFLSRVDCQILSTLTAELNERESLDKYQDIFSDLASTDRFLNPTASLSLKRFPCLWDGSLDQDRGTITRKMTTWLMKHFIFLCYTLNEKDMRQLSSKCTSYLDGITKRLMDALYLAYSRSSSPHWPVPGIHLLLELGIERSLWPLLVLSPASLSRCSESNSGLAMACEKNQIELINECTEEVSECLQFAFTTFYIPTKRLGSWDI